MSNMHVILDMVYGAKCKVDSDTLLSRHVYVREYICG